jgi:cell division protein ZapA
MKGIDIEIMGQTLTVGSDAGDEWVRAVARSVDARMRDIRASSQAISSIHLAILAALNFADELEHLKREHQALVEQLEAMNQRLSSALNGDEA